MKQKILVVFTVVVLLSGMSACDELFGDSDTPVLNSHEEMERSIIGLWWDEYEYTDVTETGVPFSRVLLVVKADADHTGCIYLGVFGATGYDPLAIYGGPKDAPFTWKVSINGQITLTDPYTGTSYAAARTRGSSSYGNNMTNVSSTSATYTDGSMAVSNDSYSGTLVKAGTEKTADIEKIFSTLISTTNLGTEDGINISKTPGGNDFWGRSFTPKNK